MNGCLLVYKRPKYKARFGVKIKQGQVEFTEYISLADCNEVVMQKIEQKQQINGEPGEDGSVKLDNIRTESVSFTVISDQAVGFANGNQLYGFNNWQINDPKDIAGRKQESSDPEPAASVGKMFYDLVKVSGNTLYIGLMDGEKDGSGSSKTANLRQELHLQGSK